MRNEHYQGIPSSPRSQPHIYHHRHFLRRDIHSDACPFAHMEKTVISLLDTSQSQARGSPDSLETQRLDVFHWSTMADYSPQMQNHELLGLITVSGNPAPSPKLLPSTSCGLFLSYGIRLLTVSNKNSCLDFHLSPVANITVISSPGLSRPFRGTLKIFLPEKVSHFLLCPETFSAETWCVI